jgi:hypothetical protein
LEKAVEIKDVPTVRQVTAVAFVRYPTAGADARALRGLFLRTLEVLTREKDASWVHEAWFRREAEQLFAELDLEELDLVLRNLRVLRKIEYHAEEVLFFIAQRAPEKVIKFFCQRIDPVAEGLTSLVLALVFGTILAYFTNTDAAHAWLRERGFTTRTSHPSEWYYVLSSKITFVVLHLRDGRRLGQFYIMVPSWIGNDGKPIDLPQLDGLLISAKDVRWVEFLRKEAQQ